MARCGCSGANCQCQLAEGPGINISGTGTGENPFVISYDEVATAVKTVSQNYKMTAKDRVILVQGTHTIKLPAVAASTGRTLIIINIGTGTVTVSGDGTNISGAPTRSLPAQYDRIVVLSSGSHWYKTGGT